MKKPDLTLRQRKLLHLIMNQKAFVTGRELAREMNVTDRTIRSDIAEINRNIIPFSAEIKAERSKGYFFAAEDKKKIQELNQMEIGLLTKDERVRYLAFRLCLADEKTDIYELEDEMYTSHTTIELDLKALQQKYVFSSPHIRMYQKNNLVAFEHDEKKIRAILTKLVHDDWNYNNRGNAYYGYYFLDEEIVDHILDEVPVCLRKYGIYLDDPALVYLEIMIAVACCRFTDGHLLPEVPESDIPECTESFAGREIFSVIEEKHGCTFPASEKKAVCDQIITSRLPDISNVSMEYVNEYVDETTLRAADSYLALIRQTFGLDLVSDEDFHATLCLTIRNFQTRSYIYNTQGNKATIKERLMDEFEIAWLFQEIAIEQFGRYLTEYELISMSYCISGALLLLFRSHPEWRLKTVICTHSNMTVLWYMKRVLMSEFGTYLDITGLIPGNSRSAFDFSNADLVIRTGIREDADIPGVKNIFVNSFITSQDAAEVATYIQHRRFEQLYPVPSFTLPYLVKNAVWHEKENHKDRNEVLRILASDFDEDPGLKDKLLQDIQDREKITSFVTGRSIVFVHSLLPARKTGLSVMTLDHRIVWNNYKIRIVVLGTFRPEDRTILFHLKHLFCGHDREEMRMLKTRQEVCEYFFPEI